MSKVSIIIPNYNGSRYIVKCMEALLKQSEKDFDVIFVDNASQDDSLEKISAYTHKLNLELIKCDANYGFSKAVNTGIKASCSDYVILLNNDAYAGKHFVEELLKAIENDGNIFSAQALMLQSEDRRLVDSAGDYLCILGAAFALGKDDEAYKYTAVKDIFSSCAGAAIYRKSIFEEIGYFEEDFFAYLEDVDIGYRSRLYGYRNIIVPTARVLHVGSGSSGSRHNEFKVRLSARNTMLMLRRNFAWWQWVVNFIPVFIGITIKASYFAGKRLLKPYISGLIGAFSKLHMAKPVYNGNRKPDYKGIEKELIYNTLIRIGLIK